MRKPQKVTLEGILGGPGTQAADNSTYLRRNYHKVGNEVGTRDFILEVLKKRQNRNKSLTGKYHTLGVGTKKSQHAVG